VPQSWTDDLDRCRAAGIGDPVEFATKPELARQMIERAIDASAPIGWVATDEVDGQNTPLRGLAGGPPCQLRARGRLRPGALQIPSMPPSARSALSAGHRGSSRTRWPHPLSLHHAGQDHRLLL
jgi:hypothetical protein